MRPGAILRAVCILVVAAPLLAMAQTRHSLDLGREATIGGVGIAFNGFGRWKEHQNLDTPLPVIDLRNVPAIDRVATRKWSMHAHRTSNVLFGIAVGASLATAIVNQHGERPLVPVVIIAESGFLSAGITNTVKELVRRPRPYLYNSDVPASAYDPRKDQVSFWSGHTANTAAITFACASLVQRSEASKGLKTATWVGAAVTPAVMGYLRVRAGKHFPTDVLTGYLFGALVGLAVPYFHRSE